MNKSKKGFTLIEILVVATIFSFIGLAIASTFMSGMRIWDRARNNDIYQYNKLLAFEGLAKELRQSLDYPAIGFEVKVKEFTFPTFLGDSIIKVTYAFDADKKNLLRRQIDLKDTGANIDKENTQEKIVLSSLDELTLSYFYHYFDKDQNREIYAWKEVKSDQDAWPKEKGIFMAIKLQGKIRNEAFTKTVIIPIS